PEDDAVLSFPQSGVWSDVVISQADTLYAAFGSPYWDDPPGTGGPGGGSDTTLFNNAVYRVDFPLTTSVPVWYVGNGLTYPQHNSYSISGEYPNNIHLTNPGPFWRNGLIKLSVQVMPGVTPDTKNINDGQGALFD